MLGAYHMVGVAPLAAGQDPRMARLRAACKAWEYRRHPAGGTLLIPKDSGTRLDACVAAVDCFDGLRWHAPAVMPTLHDLAREDMPQPSTRIELRRPGTISVPLGVGPVFGSGPRKGQPSSAMGRLAHDLYARAVDKSHDWTTKDASDTERLIFLAIQAGYSITEELFGELSPYDEDEAELLVAAVWGTDPKALASDGRTSPPSPPVSSATPG